MIEYHVREISVVTDEEIQKVLNNEVRQGWAFDDIKFVVREASRRPSMAFLVFVRNLPPADQD